MNKMTKILVGLGSMLCLVLLGSVVFSQGYYSQGYNEFQTAEVGGVYQPMGWNTFEASWLIGHRVVTPTGGELGQISSLVIDRTNGRIALVVLSDVPNLGAKVLAIPFSSITNIGADTCDFNPGSMEIGPSLGPYYYDPFVYAVTYFPSYSEFYGLPSSMDVAWLTDVYRHYGQIPYWVAEGEQAPSSLELLDSARLMGAEIQLSGGGPAGEVNDFVIDSSDGHIAFLILSDFPGRQTTLIAVPFAELSTGENGFVLYATNEQLALAVGFDESDLNNMRWAENNYRYFGLEPYWTERMQMAPGSSDEYMEP